MFFVVLLVLTFYFQASQSNDFNHLKAKVTAKINSVSDLETALAPFDANPTIRLVVIHLENNHSEIESVRQHLDEYLAPRSYWALRSEPLSFYHKDVKPIILLKVDEYLEPSLRWRSHHQYPPADYCSATPMLVFNSLDAWGSKNGEYAMNLGRWRYSIVGTYFSATGDPSKSNAMFVDAETCPTVVDKFLCAFLPTTNCTYPKTLCLPDGCKDTTLIVNADEKGVIQLPTRPNYNDMTEWNGGIPRPEVQATLVDLPPLRGSKRYMEITDQPSDSYTLGTTFIYLTSFLMYRPNAFFRERIQHLLHQFRSSQTPPLLPSTQCAAIHVRRGDRAIDSLWGQDALDFCDFCQGHIDAGAKEGKDEKESIKGKVFLRPDKNISETCDYTTFPSDYGRPDFWEMGCRKRERGFGAMTLEKYLEYAAVAVQTHPVHPPDPGSEASSLSKNHKQGKIRTAVIVTDSGSWVENQLRNLPEHIKSEWDLYHLPSAPGQTHRKFTTANGVNFLASLELISQCEAFVGHWCSAAGQYLLHKMCAHHGTAATHLHVHSHSTGSGLPSPTTNSTLSLPSSSTTSSSTPLGGIFWKCPTFFDACKE